MCSSSGSGNIVHNLRRYRTGPATDDGYDWAQRFDEDAKARMLTDPSEFTTLDAHPDFRRAVPTPDHFIPALYLAASPERPARRTPKSSSTGTPTAPCR